MCVVFTSRSRRDHAAWPQFCIFVRHLPSTPVAMFKGRKRLTWMAIQVGRVCVYMCVCVC